MKYIVGNWKSNKNLSEATAWLDAFTSYELGLFKNTVRVAIAAPFPLIALVKDTLRAFPWVKVASQDISPFGAGSYTGAVSTHNLDHLIDYCIIGHSERRKYFGETDTLIAAKTDIAHSSNIWTIVCVRSAQDIIPPHADFIAYEPVGAIGTGHNEPLENVLAVKKMLSIPSSSYFIYGGSANPGNARQY